MKFIITSVMVLLLGGAVGAGVVTVPSDYTTIEQALLATSQCDTILLEPGTYAGNGFESLSVDGRCVTIMSQVPSSSRATIIVGDTTFMFISDSANIGNGPVDVRYVNFKHGGAMFRLGPNADIGLRNCRFDSLTAGLSASYVYDTVYNLSGLVDSCWFVDCGCAISMSIHNLDLTISNNMFLRSRWCGVSLQYISGGQLSDNIVAYSIDQGYATNAFDIYATQGLQLSNNVIIGNQTGIGDDLLSWDLTYLCNTFFQNQYNTFNFPPSGTLDSGNVTLDPQFCDPNLSTIGVMPTSPLLPENNICNTLIGNVHIGCVCGDVNNSGQVDVVDLTDLVGYLFQGQPPLPSPGATNIDGIWGPGGPIDVADLTRFVWWLYQGGPTPLCFEP